MTPAVPQPRSSPDAAPGSADAALARRYATELGWATAGRAPLRLLTGALFDVLELPAEAGHAVLRRGVRTGPVLLSGTRMGLLVAAGGADELPGLLDWLEWGPVALDLTAVGAGGRVTAPPLPGAPGDLPGAAVWLRPPEPRRAPEPGLPALAGFGSSGGDAPDLVRLVDAAATECHRVRLSRARSGVLTRSGADQPLAFS
ncbi:SCO3374 family protein [Streptomyces anulatus]|uniref:SCO3374 family protein n=1 Tax=Streptomyces TaxID=1883 RepID=UPI000BF21AD5|nr:MULTISPECIES: SCO3374 family protein [unclassified Streptomyces]UPT42695.1 SCO3374 family protein [Streptomyces sp. WAC00303]WTF63532.1 SCO3374 family protein [Streptomyces anulatus]